MSNSIRISLIIVLIAFLTGSVEAGYPAGDLDGNYKVDLQDLQIFTTQWLDPSGCSGLGCADIDGQNGVNFVDFALMAENWNRKSDFLVISEFMASNSQTLLDGDGKSSDWIEIFNPTDTTVSLDGWYLTDDPDDLTKWPFPEGPEIEPSNYFVVFASGQDIDNYIDPAGYYHTNFKLKSDGEYLALVRPNLTISHEYNTYEYDNDEFGYPPQITDNSYGILFDQTTLVDENADVQILIPSDDSPGTSWTQKDYTVNEDWFAGTTAVGFEILGDIQIAGDLLVDLDAENLATGTLTSWTNNGAAGGTFDNDSTDPQVELTEGVNAVSFDNDDALTWSIPTPASITGNSSWSLELWALNPTVDTAEEVMFSWSPRYPGATQRTAQFNYGYSSSYGAYVHWGADSGWGNGIPTNGQWHHIVYTYEGGSNSAENVYVDGSHDSLVYRTLNFLTEQPMIIGQVQASPGGGFAYERDFTGSIAQVRVHSGTLNQDQVINNFLADAEYFSVTPGEDITSISQFIETDIEGQMFDINPSAYMRIEFDVNDPNTFESLTLEMRYDDGFIAYINGVKAGSRNAPTVPAWNSTATDPRPDEEVLTDEFIQIPNASVLLCTGTNVLAIQGLNITKDDKDFLIMPGLSAVSSNLDSCWYFSVPTPGTANKSEFIGLVENPDFSVDRGFYDNPFQVRMETKTEGATIRYTIDGSEPTETTGNTYDPNFPIQVNKTTCLRAFALKESYMQSNVVTQTYIFLDDLWTQTRPAGYPTQTYDPANPLDYDIDQDVIGPANLFGDIYRDTFIDDLKALPSLSIVMDVNDLFGYENGIYAHSTLEGELWERAASLELIDPNDEKEFQINMAIRMQGGYGANAFEQPKHNFRFIFSRPYGPPKLDFKLFEDTNVEEFDQLVLRTPCHDSWLTHQNNPFWGSFRRNGLYASDGWHRATQRAMGHVSIHGLWVHLYLNGLYWGVYELVERPNQAFAASYFGGEKEEYDAIGSGTPRGTSNLDSWNTMFDIIDGGGPHGSVSNPAAYEHAQEHLDVLNLVDYIIYNVYSAISDWPGWNYYAAKRRVDGEPFRIFSWDSEACFTDDRLYYNKLPGINTGVGHLYYVLKANDEFRLLVADKLYKHLKNDGVLTPQKAAQIYRDQLDRVEPGLGPESARWGDAWETIPMTRDVEWVAAQQHLFDSFFPQRADIILGYFYNDGVYPDTDAPYFNQHGGYIEPTDSISISYDSGTVYYTTDGSDPRQPLTGIAVGTMYTGSFNIPSTKNIKARAKDGTEWSALCDAVFAVGPVADNLRITEIMYHPLDTNDPNDPNEEFIELKNIGPNTINLNLVRFTNGIDFTFGDVNLALGQHIVVVKDVNVFEDKYGTGINIAGQYTGRLANEGERIRLEDALGTTILDFRYKDGWRSNTDGDGYSLTIVNPLNPDPNSWSEKDSWRPSAYITGSPGDDDSGIIPNPSDVVINEVLAHSDAYPNDWIELHNTTGSSINITGWFLSDNDANLTKYEIPATTIPPNGYVVFTQDDHFGGYFALSENGEMVCLTSKRDPNGNLTGYRQREDFGASENGVAFGRYYKASTDNYNFVAMSVNTPGPSFEGAPNAYPKVGPVVISEIMYHPEIFWGHWDAEYIELYNITGSDVHLYDANGIPWKFTDGIKFTFPPATTIPAHSYLLMVKDINVFNSEYPGAPGGVQKFEWDSGRLNNDGEKVEISMPGDIDEYGQRQYIRIDRVNYSDGSHPEDCPGGMDLWPIEADGGGDSLTRIDAELYGNDPNNWQAATPTPGS